MSIQLIIDIVLFLIYCALFTLLLAWTWKFWMLYKNLEYQKSLKYKILEIKLPRNITKSPEAAEIFLRAVYDGGGLGNWYKESWKGALPAVASLEIVSLEGIIHFYIRAEAKFIPRIESSIYSQYPNVEIFEAEDYVDILPNFTRENKEKYVFWGTDWKLSKTSKIEEYGDEKNKKMVKLEYSGDMYPIKTYKDFGLDKDPKEEYKHDPISYLIEQLASVGEGEYFCHQILIRDAAKWNNIYTLKADKDLEENKELSELIKYETEKYKKKWTFKKAGDKEKDEWGNYKGKEIKNDDGSVENKPYTYIEDMIISKSIAPAEREEDAKSNLDLIKRKISKPQVISKMRTIYVSKDGSKFGTRIPMVMGLLRSFNEDGFNSFGPDMSTFPDPFNYPWQDPRGIYVATRKENLFNDYKDRAGMFSFISGIGEKTNKILDNVFFKKSDYSRIFYTTLHSILFHPFTPTKELGGFTLNLEELATLFHFPGEVVSTPTLQRIDSSKSSSPHNLPM